MLHFGLAKAYEDLGEKDRGFTHLLQGNAIRRAEDRITTRTSTIAGLDRLPSIFTPELLAAKDPGDRSEEPVFIVGMPRSGTTLVEQILASHPHRYSAPGKGPSYPASVGRLQAERLGTRSASGKLFLDDARRDVPASNGSGLHRGAAASPLPSAAPRITDKMPINFVHVGSDPPHPTASTYNSCRTRPGRYVIIFHAFPSCFAGDQPFAFPTILRNWADFIARTRD